MKQCSFKVVCLIIWACITVFPGFSSETTQVFVSTVLETFNGTGDSPWAWRAEASRFITRTRTQNGETVEANFPYLAHIEAWPVAAFGTNRDGSQELRSLGIHGRFDRRGYNWIDIFPVSADDPDAGPVEIPMPGRIHSMDMWVWGSNLRYSIEVYLRDHQGVVHTLPLGNLAFAGWRNLRVNIPGHIQQSRRILPSFAPLHFVKFRIWTQPTERVDNFFVYFKQLQVLADTYATFFDGNDLADPRNVERLWANTRD